MEKIKKSKVFKNKNCLIDTHTAVAVHAADCYAREHKAERKIPTQYKLLYLANLFK